MSTPEIKSLRLSHSSQATLHSCARKLEFKKFYQHAAYDGDSTPAEVGKALHVGYQTYLVTGSREQAAFEMMMNYPFHLNSDGRDDRSVYAAYGSLEALCAAAPLVEYELARFNVNGVEVPGIEVPFEFRIKNFSLSDRDNVPVTYVGKVDAVMYNRESQEYGVLDIKTHRRNLWDLSPLYQYDQQLTPYGIVLEHLLNQPIESITARYLSCYVDLVNPKVALYPFVRTKESIDDWAQVLRLDLQLLKTYYMAGWFPRNSGSCLSFNRKCAFLDMCQERDAEVLQKIILMGQEGEDQAGKADHFGTPWVSIELDLGF